MGSSGGANIATNGAFLLAESGALSTCGACCPTCRDRVQPDRWLDLTLDADPFYHATQYPQCPSQCIFGWDVDPSGTYRRYIPGRLGESYVEPWVVGSSRQGECRTEGCINVVTHYYGVGLNVCWGVGITVFNFWGPWIAGVGWGIDSPPLPEGEVRCLPIPYVSNTAVLRVSFVWI